MSHDLFRNDVPPLTVTTHNDADIHRIGDELPVPTVVRGGVPTMGTSSVAAREDHVHPFYDVSGNVLFTTGGGDTYLNGAKAYFLKAQAELQLGSAVTLALNAGGVSANSFVLNGISIGCQVGDLISINANLRQSWAAAASGYIRYMPQIFLPIGGSTVLATNDHPETAGNLERASSATWSYTVLNAGVHTITILGATIFSSGTIQIVPGLSNMVVQQFGSR